MMIHFLQNHEIDKAQWDRCIDDSPHSLIYAWSWYLDLVSPGWCGICNDDYSTVMPLPVKKKYGVHYIMQPLYCQQLGVFSKKSLTEADVEEFINAIPLKYKYISLNLNFGNHLIPGIKSQKLNNNYEIALDWQYGRIKENYTTNTRRNIQKSSRLEISFECSVQELIRLKSSNTGEGRKFIPPDLISRHITTVMERNAGFICGASQEGITIAAAFFLIDKRRIYYLIPVSDPLGKKLNAMQAILDAVIQKYAGTQVTLDFEGSNIAGIARFFKGFGAVNNPYPTIRINRLPFPLNLIRK